MGEKLQYYFYQEALALLFSENPQKEELVDALVDMLGEYYHVYYSALHGYRENATPELIRLTVVIEFLKTKIKHKEESC